ncbi:uncharacterized protein LOC117782195 [Drosophila innubila]|uniref:uncharacterized protein LOC117782195 n=1 Tax=Drosophila innubila TaxID=198719 RepID=UPI00148BB27F|nr:uncharacterized protein LOC117782195 [Drosophila innubila]
MCKLQDLDVMCCSLRGKSIFLAWWTLAHAILLLIANTALFVIGNFKMIIIVSSTIYVILHMLGAIFLFVGVYKEIPCLFLFGIILSSIVPYACLITIYLPIVQIIFTITSCRYLSIMEGVAKK